MSGGNGDLRVEAERVRESRPWIDEVGKSIIPSITVSDSLRESMCSPGSCYEVAAKAAVENRLVLVHGWPVGQGGEIKGLRYGHAWCEMEEEVEFPPGTSESFVGSLGGLVKEDGRLVMPIRMALDLTAPAEDLLVVPCALYYFAGGIRPSSCIPYQWEEVSELLVKHRTWGPWREPPEEYIDELVETAKLVEKGLPGMSVLDEDDALA